MDAHRRAMFKVAYGFMDQYDGRQLTAKEWANAAAQAHNVAQVYHEDRLLHGLLMTCLDVLNEAIKG